MQLLKPLEVKIRRLRNRMSPLIYRGDAVFCPVCERAFSQFLAAGSKERHREGAVCPFCRSRERDRLNSLFFKQNQELFSGDSVAFLHVAPEPELAKLFKEKAGAGYMDADLMRKDVMVKLDVSDMQFEDNHFDAIYCSHVLQDVPDDSKAIQECYRVLKPGGWAILNVAIHGDETEYFDTPGNQRKIWDKRPDEFLRRYGRDYTEKLKASGFDFNVVTPEDLVGDAAERERLGIATREAGYVHFLKK